MGYANLAACVRDLEATGRLRRIAAPIDPVLEAGIIQRRAFVAGGPALLFENCRNTPFPMLANLFGTRERLEYIFRDTLPGLKSLIT